MDKIRRKLSTKKVGLGKEGSQVRQSEGEETASLSWKDSNKDGGSRSVTAERTKVRRSQTMKETTRRSSQKPRRGEGAPVRLSPYCLICYGDYSQPKQLPCGHTFCHACIEKYVNPKLMVECPQCRQVSLHCLSFFLNLFLKGS